MKYKITTLVFSSPGYIDISEQDYKSIKSARDRLFESLFIEEKFDLVVENYLEYEVEMLSSSVRYMVSRNQDYEWFQTQRCVISRRVVNLLSACRLYRDQIVHHLQNIYGDGSNNVDVVLREISEQHDTHLGYRAMEALRNYMQHRGFPVHGVTYDTKAVGPESGRRVLFALTPYIDLSALEEDKKFKKTVLQEMQAMGKEIDIKPLIREYIECMGRIQEKVREIIGRDNSEWEGTLDRAIVLFKERFGSEVSLIGLAAVAEEEDGSHVETTSIFTDFIERKRELERKNRLFGSLVTRYITNETIDTGV